AQNVVLSDMLPAGTTAVSFDQQSGPAFTLGLNGSTFMASAASFAAGATATFQMVVTANANDANGSTISNTSSVASNTTDPAPGNNSSTVNTTVNTSANLQVTKTGPATATAGTNVTYTVTVANNGPSDA